MANDNPVGPADETKLRDLDARKVDDRKAEEVKGGAKAPHDLQIPKVVDKSSP